MIENLPRPEIDDDSRPFWEGLKKNRLMIQYCNNCHNHIFYPRIICPHCFSEKIEWREAVGKGIIYSYTVVHRAMPPFQKLTPYMVGIIELSEGVRMLCNIVGDREKIAIGEKVEVNYKKINDEFTLPYFQLI